MGFHSKLKVKEEGESHDLTSPSLEESKIWKEKYSHMKSEYEKAVYEMEEYKKDVALTQYAIDIYN
jgi:hypothetical protein